MSQFELREFVGVSLTGLPEPTIAPENRFSQMENSIQTINFQVLLLLVSGRATTFSRAQSVDRVESWKWELHLQGNLNRDFGCDNHYPPKNQLVPKKGTFQKRKVIFQPSFLRDYVSSRGSEFRMLFWKNPLLNYDLGLYIYISIGWGGPSHNLNSWIVLVISGFFLLGLVE